MALGEYVYLRAEIKRENVEEILISLGKTMNQYLYKPLPENASITDFFNTFPEGDENLLNPNHFFVQNRIKPDYRRGFSHGGRLGISLNFESSKAAIGVLTIQVIDNGENVNEDFHDEIYSVARQYFMDEGLIITDKGIFQ